MLRRRRGWGYAAGLVALAAAGFAVGWSTRDGDGSNVAGAGPPTAESGTRARDSLRTPVRPAITATLPSAHTLASPQGGGTTTQPPGGTTSTTRPLGGGGGGGGGGQKTTAPRTTPPPTTPTDTTITGGE
jgi:hypothetical protein